MPNGVVNRSESMSFLLAQKNVKESNSVYPFLLKLIIISLKREKADKHSAWGCRRVILIVVIFSCPLAMHRLQLDVYFRRSSIPFQIACPPHM